MRGADFEKAKQYVFNRLERELSPKLFYHSIAHTRDDVLPAVERLAELEGITDPEELLLLRTSALYHDIGFIEAYSDHEDVSIRIAADTLPQFGYSEQHIERIQQVIRATEMPQNPDSHLAMLLADADLDILGREDFLLRNKDLYLELDARDIKFNLEDWYRSQLRLLQAHQYFTDAARSLRQPGKQRNIEKMEGLLVSLTNPEAVELSVSPSEEQSRSVLARVPLFQNLPAEEINFLATTLRPVEFGGGSIVLLEDDPGEYFYVIIEGNVEIIKSLGTPEERRVGVRGPGEFIGEMSLFIPNGLRTASARSVGESRLLELTRADFESLLERQSQLSLEFVQVLSTRLSDSHNKAMHDLHEKNRRLSEAYAALKVAQKELIEKERMERELQVAYEIQRSILPYSLPQVPGFEFGALIVPAKEVGGDFYDILPLSNGKIGIVLGDITDKGVPAAIFMAQTHALIHAAANQQKTPRSTLLKVNQHLLEMNQGNMFATILYGVLDCPTGKFSYARAGHELPVLRLPDGETVVAEMSAGMPLGLLEHPEIDQQTLTLKSGSTMLLYTDGVTDALTHPGQRFGREGLTQILRQASDMPAQKLCELIYSSLVVPDRPEWRVDDVTLFAVRLP